jgi:twitching motility two-component system response regulator PilH
MKNISISRWLQRNKDKARPSEPIRGLENLNVLVVDDSRTQLHVMEKMLNAVGINTMTAENGRQAILVARHQKPDIILMDIVMPEINGFQATRYLTRQPDTRHIPIIIISGSDQDSDKAWGLKLGARDYMKKPVDKAELLRKIASLVKLEARPVSAISTPVDSARQVV